MAKDPAFLFYPGDWHSGTMLLSRHQKGCYIDILIAQFNNGPLSLESIKTILGQDQASWTVLSSKFKQNSAGNYFNERLATEVEKRKAYSESRRKNKEGKSTHDPTYVKHMTPHMENENRNEDLNRNYFPKDNLFPIEYCLLVAMNDARWVKANKTNTVELELFNGYLERLGTYQMIPIDYKKYFAKLKGKYPDMLKKELSIEDLRKIAKELDENKAA